ncbi:Crp/Fnr family transcriptional regulator [Vibrio sp.]|nr:Crp/Fnr family transcriptional regulator [Vibrio sp.]
MDYPYFKDVLLNAGIGQADIDSKILPLFQTLTVTKETHLLQIGDRFDSVFIIRTGAVRLYYLSPSGNESNKQFFFENDVIFPVAPVAYLQPSRFAIACCEDVSLLKASYKQFKSTIEKLGDWDKWHIEYLKWLANQKVQREYDFLTKSASERFKSILVDNNTNLRRVADFHLASYLGMTPVSLSRIKHQ